LCENCWVRVCPSQIEEEEEKKREKGKRLLGDVRVPKRSQNKVTLSPTIAYYK